MKMILRWCNYCTPWGCSQCQEGKDFREEKANEI